MIVGIKKCVPSEISELQSVKIVNPNGFKLSFDLLN